MNVAAVPAKLRRPRTAMTCAPAVALGIVIVVPKLPVEFAVPFWFIFSAFLILFVLLLLVARNFHIRKMGLFG